MAVTIPSNATRNEFTQGTGVSSGTITQYAIFTRINAKTAIGFEDDNLVSNSGSFAYRLRGATSDRIRVSFRTSLGTESRYHTVSTFDEYVNCLTTVDLTANVMRHYFDGVQSGSDIDLTGDSLLSTTLLLEVAGTDSAGRDFEYERIAEWRNSIPTAGDIAALQSGDAFSSLTNVPTAYYEPTGSNGAYAATLVDVGGTNDMTHTQGPTSGGSEPVFSGAVDSVSLPVIDRVIGCTGYTDSATFTLSGAYSSALTDDIQIRIINNGSPIPGLDWQTVDSFASDVWSHEFVDVPAGAPLDEYVIQARILDAIDTVLASASSGTTNVGIAGCLSGQSNGERMGNTPSPAVTPVGGAFVDGGSGASQSGAAIQSLANEITSRTGKACLIYIEAQGGTAITLLKPGSTFWDTVFAPLVSNSINMNFMTWVQGESDAGTLPSEYKADLTSIFDEILSISGQTASGFAFLVSQTGRNFTDPLSYSTSWVQIRETQREWTEEGGSRYLAGTNIAAEHAPDAGEPNGFDPLHYSNEWYAYDQLPRVAKTYANVAGLSPSDGAGPALTSFYIDGSDIRVRLNLNGASSLVSTGTGNLTGLRLWTDNTFTTEVTMSSSSIDGNELLITPAIAPTEGMLLANFRETNPDVTNSVAGTGYDINDIGLQMSEAEFSAEVSGGGAISSSVTAAFKNAITGATR